MFHCLCLYAQMYIKLSSIQLICTGHYGKGMFNVLFRVGVRVMERLKCCGGAAIPNFIQLIIDDLYHCVIRGEEWELQSYFGRQHCFSVTVGDEETPLRRSREPT